MTNRDSLRRVHARLIRAGLLVLLVVAVMNLNGCLLGCSHGSWGSKHGWKCHSSGSGAGHNPRGPDPMALRLDGATHGVHASPGPRSQASDRPPIGDEWTIRRSLSE